LMAGRLVGASGGVAGFRPSRVGRASRVGLIGLLYNPAGEA
jgi:hypothetical protein